MLTSTPLTFKLDVDSITKVSLLVLHLEVLTEIRQELLAVEDAIAFGLGEVNEELLLRVGGLRSGLRLQTRHSGEKIE